MTLLLWLGLGAPALAGGPGAEPSKHERTLRAEAHRLESELDKLARKLSWDGVERVYDKMLRLGTPLSTHVHYTAALSAQSRGDIGLTRKRLERALREIPALKEKSADGIDFKKSLPEQVFEHEGDGADARLLLESLANTYGQVRIQVAGDRLPALVRLGAKPFTQAERSSITHAQSMLSTDHRFAGPLPVGRYMVDGQMFEVVVGEPIEVTVGQP